MIGFFPTPYQDELLYSILARYYFWSANTSPKVALRELFGKTTTIATFDLPSNLENLIKNLTIGSRHTVDSFIQRNTLYPFYSPFLSSEKSDIHSRTGIIASSIPQIKFFRFCQLCLQEDIKINGEPYWHRLHQIPGVLICSKHQIFLQNSEVRTQGENRHKFSPADLDNCIFKPHIVTYDRTILNRLSDLAKDIEIIINLVLPSRSGNWFQRKYNSILIEKGLATASGRIYQKDFINEFLSFYGRSFLQLVHSDFDVNDESNWLSSLVRKHRKVFHPLRHLLLIRFLKQDIQTFFESENLIQYPFGKGPWICFNGATNHYLKNQINSISISYSSEIKKLIGTFSCECGFVYLTSEMV
jgi:hypothetical protein